MMKVHQVFLFVLIALALVACDKGYEVRFTNYHIEKMDSVSIGENKVVFTDIDVHTTTSFQKISKGQYHISLVTEKKKRFYSTIEIPKTGTGKRTIQIDGINQISILEE
jgi:hypothetical protein